MDFSLDEVVQLTGARVVRWPHSSDRVNPIHQLHAAAPGTLLFPMYRSEITEILLSTLEAARASVVTHEPPDAEHYPYLGVLSLPSPPLGYFQLAARAREHSAALVVGITGSSGKSSTKEYLAAILRSRHRVVATENSHNLMSDCASTLLELTGSGNEAAVIEMGFGWAGDVDRMAALARPLAGIITKVTPDHLDGVGGSWEGLIREKAKLGRHLPPEGILAIHAEDPGCALLPRQGWRAQVFTFGAGPQADVRYEAVRAHEGGTDLLLQLFGQRLPCRLRTFGAMQAANAAAAALVAHVLGIPGTAIQERLEATPPLPRRFQIHRFHPALTVIDDSFSSSFDASMLGLEQAAALAGDRRHVALLSKFAGLNGQAEKYFRQIGQQVAACGYAQLLLLGDGPERAIADGAMAAGMTAEQIRSVPDPSALPSMLLDCAGPNTLIYCKASQMLWIGPILDHFRDALAGAGYEPLPAGGEDRPI